MHIQEPQIHDIRDRARAAGKVTVLGGPSVSGAPEKYGDFDYLHIGEIGDATDQLVARLDGDVTPPPDQVVLETKDRLALADHAVQQPDVQAALVAALEQGLQLAGVVGIDADQGLDHGRPQPDLRFQGRADARPHPGPERPEPLR